MPKRKTKKEEEKKADAFQSAFQRTADWVKGHRAACIAGVVAAVVVAIVLWSYAAYRTGKDERAQYALTQGMNSLQEYAANPKGDGLSKAEGSFKELAQESSGGLRDVARLYLAKIAAMKGMKEPARRLFAEINNKPSNDVVRSLAEIGLRESGAKK
jgi:hypothetical protein